MRPYFSLFKLRLINGLQYRAAAFAGVATQFFWGFMYIMIYEAFYSNTVTSQPISLTQLITYIWLQQAFLVFIMFWFRDNDIFDLITSGNIAYELCRPIDIYNFWYAKLLAQRLSGALLRCFPILIIASMLPYPYKLLIPSDFVTLILFIITLLIGVLVIVAMSMFIYILTFKTMSPMGPLLIFSIMGEFFSGMTIPLPLMPEWLRQIAYVLPFRLSADLPFRVYTGNVPKSEALTGIIIQVSWLIVLVVMGKLFLSQALKKVEVQGG